MFYLKQLFCKHDFRPYCFTESREEFEKIPYEIRLLRQECLGISAEYEPLISCFGSTKICVKCGRKIRKANTHEEMNAEILRLYSLNLKTNNPVEEKQN